MTSRSLDSPSFVLRGGTGGLVGSPTGITASPSFLNKLSPRTYVSDYSQGDFFFIFASFLYIINIHFKDFRGSPQITNRAMLDRFLRESEGAASKTAALNITETGPTTPARSGTIGSINLLFSPFSFGSGISGGPFNFMQSPSFVGQFQSASVNKMVSIKKKERRIEGGYLAKDPASALGDLNIEPYIDDWAEKIRWWISETVVKPLVKRIVRHL